MTPNETIQETIAKASPREVRELAQYLYDYICNSNTIVLEQGIIEQALEAYGGGAK